MSATLRHDIGMGLVEAIATEKICLNPFAPKRRQRWAGVHRNRWQCVTFAIRLPSQLDEMGVLLHTLRGILVDDRYSRPDQNAARVLARKLIQTLGLPSPGYTAEYLTGRGQGIMFTNDIAELPFLEQLGSDLGAWGIYSDWLQEHDDPYYRKRGELIVGWMGPKALEVKYGVPLLAKEAYPK